MPHDVPPSSLLDPKKVQLCQKAEVVGTWCRSQLPALKGGERGVLKAPGLDEEEGQLFSYSVLHQNQPQEG